MKVSRNQIALSSQVYEGGGSVLQWAPQNYHWSLLIRRMSSKPHRTISVPLLFCIWRREISNLLEPSVANCTQVNNEICNYLRESLTPHHNLKFYNSYILITWCRGPLIIRLNRTKVCVEIDYLKSLISQYLMWAFLHLRIHALSIK